MAINRLMNHTRQHINKHQLYLILYDKGYLYPVYKKGLLTRFFCCKLLHIKQKITPYVFGFHINAGTQNSVNKNLNMHKQCMSLFSRQAFCDDFFLQQLSITYSARASSASKSHLRLNRHTHTHNKHKRNRPVCCGLIYFVNSLNRDVHKCAIGTTRCVASNTAYTRLSLIYSWDYFSFE